VRKILILSADNAIWRILGRTCSDEHWPGESGQVIFDKSANDGLNLAVIHLSNHMMDNYEKQYEYLTYGDKDTYVSLTCVSPGSKCDMALTLSVSHSTPWVFRTSSLHACSPVPAGSSGPTP
jgi:hypothetical protein